MAISIGICLVFSQMLPIMTINLVKEKEKRIKEAMFMMGLRPTVYWLVWFGVEAVIVLIVSLVMSLLFSLTSFIQNSNFMINFPLIFMVGLTFVEMSAILSMLFDTELVRKRN